MSELTPKEVAILFINTSTSVMNVKTIVTHLPDIVDKDAYYTSDIKQGKIVNLL